MTADLTYAEALESAQAILDRRSDILDFELLCGFTHWLLGYVLDSLREESLPTKPRYAWPGQVSETLEWVCRRSTVLFAPFFRQDFTIDRSPELPAAGDEPALYAHRATGFSLCRALAELKAPTRRWARGNTDEALAEDAQSKRALAIALTEEVFAALREVAASFTSVDVHQFSRSIKAAEAVCQAALSVLWSIASCGHARDNGLDGLVATLDEVIESDFVLEAGRLAERAVHRIWMRLHDEIADIERRHALATA